MSLSAVLTTDAVDESFYAEYNAGKAFLHSHSYTGNPLGCRVALETLALFRDETVLERNRQLVAHLARRLAPLRERPHVGGVRQPGMSAALEQGVDQHARQSHRGRRYADDRIQRDALT